LRWEKQHGDKFCGLPFVTKLCKVMKLSGRRQKASVTLREREGQTVGTGITEGKRSVLHVRRKGEDNIKTDRTLCVM